MANEQNLVKGDEIHKFTPEEHSKGGKASAEARRRKRDLRIALEMLLEKEYQGKDGTVLSGAEALATKQFEKAMKGDSKAFEIIRDTAGQKPTESIEINTINPETIAEVEEMIKNAKERHNRDTSV